MAKIKLPPLPSETRALDAANVAALTSADIENMSGPALVAAFNALTGEAVKRFAIPADGRRRLLAAIMKALSAAPKPGVDGVAKNQRDLITPIETTYLQRTAEKDKRLAALNGERTAKPVKAPPGAPKPAKEGGKPTIAGRCREMFVAGRDNAAVWEVVRKEFAMPDTKKWFVAWYRADEKRKAARS